MGNYLDKIFQIVEEDIVPLEQDFLRSEEHTSELQSQ